MRIIIFFPSSENFIESSPVKIETMFIPASFEYQLAKLKYLTHMAY